MAQGPIQSPIALCDPLATIGPVAAALLRGPPVPYPFFALGEAPTISVGLVPALPCATLQANARAVRALCCHLPISLRHHGLCAPSWAPPVAGRGSALSGASSTVSAASEPSCGTASMRLHSRTPAAKAIIPNRTTTAVSVHNTIRASAHASIPSACSEETL